jgi:hypothetical protein
MLKLKHLTSTTSTPDLGKEERYIRKIERWMMLPGRILSGGEGRDLVHPEDPLELLPLMKLNLSTSEWNLLQKGK